MKSSFPERFGEILEQRGIKVAWLSEELGISKKSIYEFLKGEIYPSTESLIKIAECLGVSLDYLTGRIDNPTEHVLLQEDDDIRENILYINESYRKMSESERRIIHNLVKTIREEKERKKK